MAVKPIPDGYHSITAGMNIKNADKAIEWFQKVFNAELKVKMPGPDGKIVHCEMKIGDSILMLGEAVRDPVHNLHAMLYVTDSDAAFKRAVDNGATVKRPMADMFWGDRAGSVVDPFGNEWFIATHKEDVPPEELKKRAEAYKPA
jgi:PhnB protein